METNNKWLLDETGQPKVFYRTRRKPLDLSTGI